MTENIRKEIANLLVLVIPQSFYLKHIFHNFDFLAEIAKVKV